MTQQQEFYSGELVTDYLPPVLLPSLKRLDVMGILPEMTEFLAMNASSLESLRLMYFLDPQLPAALQSATSLSQFHIGDLDERTSLSFLRSDKMRSLHIHVEDENQSVLSHVVETVKRLPFLTDFELTLGFDFKDTAKENLISTLFDRSHKMETVMLNLRSSENMDLLIERLVRNNRQLHSISLKGVLVSNPVLSSISYLEFLQSLDVQPGPFFTTQAVLGLLTGAAGSSLTCLRLADAPRVDMQQTGNQFKMMLRKRGLTSDQEQWDEDERNGIHYFH